jgi:hypothetical protein
MLMMTSGTEDDVKPNNEPMMFTYPACGSASSTAIGDVNCGIFDLRSKDSRSDSAFQCVVSLYFAVGYNIAD